MGILEPVANVMRTVSEGGEEAEGKVTLPWPARLNVFCVRKFVRGILRTDTEGLKTGELVSGC